MSYIKRPRLIHNRACEELKYTLVNYDEVFSKHLIGASPHLRAIARVLLDRHFTSINDRKRTPNLTVLVRHEGSLHSIRSLPYYGRWIVSAVSVSRKHVANNWDYGVYLYSCS